MYFNFHISRPVAFLFYVVSVVLLVSLTGTATPVQAGDDRDFNSGPCSKTSFAALRACRNESRDDYWIAVGNCNNLLTFGAIKKCLNKAEDDLTEAQEECGAQYEAREGVCEGLGQAPYHPIIKPSEFLDPASIAANPNPYLPLVPGITRIYHAEDEVITVEVTHDTKEILGVTTIVVHDVVTTTDGELIEDTFDWLTQDVYGNVWYFGEIAKDYEDGELVSIDGSWTAGVDGAKAGVLMKAAPQVGDFYRQEFALGEAEDMGEVVSVTGSESVPAASCNNTCVVTKDFTPIEPDVLEFKYYAPGIGVILEVDPESGDRVELVQVITN